jgi:hypothetical protein
MTRWRYDPLEGRDVEEDDAKRPPDAPASDRLQGSAQMFPDDGGAVSAWMTIAYERLRQANRRIPSRIPRAGYAVRIESEEERRGELKRKE